MPSLPNTLFNLPLTGNLSGHDLGSLGPLLPGVYHFDTSAELTGTLTLDAHGDPAALFVFQIGSALTTASNAVVRQRKLIKVSNYVFADGLMT